MGIFSLDEQFEYLELERQVKELKEQLRIAIEGRQFFYKDAKAEHMRAERLQAELNRLRAQLATTNPEDTYLDDFVIGPQCEDYYNEELWEEQNNDGV